MNKIIKYFDDFTFHARVMPVLVVLLPIIAFGIYKGIVIGNILDISIYFLVVIIFLSFTSRISRELGKQHENRMYLELNGMPTTILLRYTDNTIDVITKNRYHKKLNAVIDGINLPIDAKNENNECDEEYKSAINWLRNYANSHRDTEQRVYQELKEYNFWRNLYGSRFIAIALYLCIATREVIIIDEFSVKQMFLEPYPIYIAFLIMLFSILLFLFMVNKHIVKLKAFDYAKALIEVCERL